MHVIAIILLITLLSITIVKAEEFEIASGQVWSTNETSISNLKVFIGKVDDEDPDILHIGVRGLPDLDRSPKILERLSPGQPFYDPHSPCISCMRRGALDFYFTYDVSPNRAKTAVRINISYVPIRRTALLPSLKNIERSSEIATPYFTTAWQNWDYLRDNYGSENPTSPIADAPLADIIKVAMKVADRRLNYFEEYEGDLSIFGGQVYFETDVETVVPDDMISVPDDMATAEEIINSNESSKDDQ